MPQDVVVVHANETPPETWSGAVFLAGPLPRADNAVSWHPEAIRLLREQWRGDGTLVVFSPEPRGGLEADYDGQIAWEERSLHLADVILFWVPRDLATMPAFTTNIEWGIWHATGKAVLGAPEDAPGNAYLFRQAETRGVPSAFTLDGAVAHALDRIGTGAVRTGGEREIPIFLWRSDSLQTWLAAQQRAGNTLLAARVVWAFRVGPARAVHYWALHVSVHVGAEDRVKDNEVVISRPDTAVVVLYRPAPDPDDTAVVLVREFRSPASTPDGFVHEPPGGSGPGPVDAAQALAEVEEETGLVLTADRLRPLGSRQVAGTISAHHAHLFAAEITEAELAALAAAPGPHGVGGGEVTWIEITTFGQIRKNPLADWASLGMISQALTG
ncbi:nucleoside 2-deoxyribosyltransferase domain-containing protein [Glycomyces harbinensis]|uniref:Nucleoside 2-deoxyribosyltransferase like n=1 Tax=Glycomyces harbinensis TaxID=58114 RepID=A0A1G6R040_9ACTN|nr:nucleoside 2-deoxyribosyltransferase domain-containing protein [Glycomyces harbinensis]SDC97367.1 Nucleoside 2-deoxyribosyltransferase like [Glycomyces harbinensis]